MTNKKELLEPPRETIMAGYAMMKGRQAFIDGNYTDGHWYLSQALRCVQLATPIVVEQTGMYYMEPSKGVRLLLEAADTLSKPGSGHYAQLAAAYKIGEAHDFFRRLMGRKGYRDINDRDFAEHGVGGGR